MRKNTDRCRATLRACNRPHAGSRLHRVASVMVLAAVYELVAGARAHLFAQGALPWEGPLILIKNSVTGPVAQTIGVLALVVAGLGWALGESGSFLRTALGLVFGLSVALSAAAIISTFFG